MNALIDEVSRADHLTPLSKLCIYVTGSYGRGDANTNSDVDIFFVHLGPEENGEGLSRVQKTLADADLIKICRKLEFPEFTKGGMYLDIHYLEDMLKALGSREDDHRNFFTARMLLLLESKCILHREIYNQVVNGILDTYYRDFVDHETSFRPHFLLNDIMRYWKTMCLNYEARRTDKLKATGDATEELVKNFKLRYSRLLICFSMIVPLIASAGVPREDVLRLVELTPFERLAQIASTESASKILQKLLDEYEWFLMETEDKPSLVDTFKDKGRRSGHFERAAQFGNLMYQLIDSVKKGDESMRYLIV